MKNKRTISATTFFNSRVTATISISLVLFLLGLIILLTLFAGNLSSYVKERFSFDIILNEEVKHTQVTDLMKKLEKTVFVKSTEYISKADAAKQLEEDLGQNPEDFLGFNPLPEMIVVHLNSRYANTDSLFVVESQIKGFSTNIKDIEYRKELMEIVNDNLRNAGIILLGLTALLLIISFALINNTIRLTVYSKRFLIHTMKLVGATAGFIRKPFIRAQVVSGIIAAIIANGLLFWLLYYISNDLGNLSELVNANTLYIVFGGVFVLGILISVAATFSAVNKYIRMDEGDLYYI
ncbi:MAG: permease-like cell division protein FtsX [Dysgonamonadaceae bacterium]|jgi:cell division transport system permease protein|nr:permease-like cell division protein FtsX [Dysgonamonadaceae bacterium]